MNNEEIIVSSAVISADGRLFVGTRHDECYHSMISAGVSHVDARQGFVTNQCRWLDRKEALAFAIKTNQLRSRGTDGVLYSEDLW
jgi:hypothetical protein